MVLVGKGLEIITTKTSKKMSVILPELNKERTPASVNHMQFILNLTAITQITNVGTSVIQPCLTLQTMSSQPEPAHVSHHFPI